MPVSGVSSTSTMVAHGYTKKEIAAALGITVITVESHKTKIMQKLGITSRRSGPLRRPAGVALHVQHVVGRSPHR